MKAIYRKYRISKFHSFFLGLLFAISAIPFTFIGILIISNYGTESYLLWIPVIGILGSLIFGLQAMHEADETEQKKI